MISILNKKNISNGLFLLVLIYTFTYLAFDKVGKTALLISTLAILIYNAKYNKKFFSTLPFYLMISALVVSITTWIAITISSQIVVTPSNSVRAEHILDKFAFIPLALILAESHKRVLVFIFVAIISALLNPWLAGNGLEEITLSLNGLRTGFGGHIITMGTIYAVILIAAFIFMNRLPKNSFKISAIALFLWGFIVIAAGIGVYASQTRAIYFSLIFLYFLYFSSLIYFSATSWNKTKPILFNFFTLSAVLFSCVGLLFYNGYFEWILSKSDNEQSVFWLLLEGKLEEIPKNSSGLRIHFWIEAFRWIVERPIFGWGVGANRQMHEQAGFFFENRPFISLHNDFIEILFTYGLLGLLLFITLITWLYRAVYQGWKAGHFPTDSLIFFIFFLISFILNGLFMSILFFRETVFLWNVVLASFTGIVFKYQFFDKTETT